MWHHDVMPQDAAQAGIADPPSEGDVLGVDEEGVVESAEGAELLPADRHARAADPVDVDLRPELGLGEQPGSAEPLVQARGVHRRTPYGRLPAGRAHLHLAVGPGDRSGVSGCAGVVRKTADEGDELFDGGSRVGIDEDEVVVCRTEGAKVRRPGKSLAATGT